VCETRNVEIRKSKNVIFPVKFELTLKSSSSGFVRPCCDVLRYQRFGGLWCLHLQGEDGNFTSIWRLIFFR